jgi:hypothetical protein
MRIKVEVKDYTIAEFVVLLAANLNKLNHRSVLQYIKNINFVIFDSRLDYNKKVIDKLHKLYLKDDPSEYVEHDEIALICYLMDCKLTISSIKLFIQIMNCSSFHVSNEEDLKILASKIDLDGIINPDDMNLSWCCSDCNPDVSEDEWNSNKLYYNVRRMRKHRVTDLVDCYKNFKKQEEWMKFKRSFKGC